MSWIPPVTKNAVKYGVKYGPQAKVAWDAAGKQVQAAAKSQADNLAARRQAFAEAATVIDGSVLRRVWAGKPVWIVYSGDQPLSAYPPPSVDVTQVTANADLSKRVTPDQHRDAQLPARAKRAGKTAAKAGRQAAAQTARLRKRG